MVERRETTLTPKDLESIGNLLSIKLGGLTEAEHMQSHEAIKVFIDRENKKIERMEKNKTAVMVAIVISVTISSLSVIAYLVWLGFLQQLGH